MSHTVELCITSSVTYVLVQPNPPKTFQQCAIIGELFTKKLREKIGLVLEGLRAQQAAWSVDRNTSPVWSV